MAMRHASSAALVLVAMYILALNLLSRIPPGAEAQASIWEHCANSAYEYQYNDFLMTFDRAVAFCKTKLGGAYLAIPRNALEDKCISDHHPLRTRWLGIRKLNGIWTDIKANVEVNYTNWEVGQPNMNTAAEGTEPQECVTLWYYPKQSANGDKWDNLQCDHAKRVVCQRQGRCAARSNNSLVNGYTSHYSVLYPGNITYQCNPGYYISGQSNQSITSHTSLCLISGHWSTPEPTCIGITCVAPPPALANSSILSQELVYPGIVTYQCDVGYYVAGYAERNVSNATVQCAPNGTWIGTAPTCLLWPAVDFIITASTSNISSFSTSYVQKLTSFSAADSDHHPGRCTVGCVQNGYLFGGMANSTECYCTSFAVSKLTKAAGLTYECTGAPSYQCGGNNLISFYALREAPPVKAHIGSRTDKAILINGTLYTLAGTTINLECTVITGTTPLVYTWRKTGSDMLLSSSSVLSRIVTSSDSEPIDLSISSPISEAVEGTSFNATCTASHSAGVSFVWKKINPATGIVSSLPSRASFSIKTGVLLIPRLLMSDQGVYCCVASKPTIAIPANRRSVADLILVVTAGDACAGECSRLSNMTECNRTTGLCQCRNGLTGSVQATCTGASKENQPGSPADLQILVYAGIGAGGFIVILLVILMVVRANHGKRDRVTTKYQSRIKLVSGEGPSTQESYSEVTEPSGKAEAGRLGGVKLTPSCTYSSDGKSRMSLKSHAMGSETSSRDSREEDPFGRSVHDARFYDNKSMVTQLPSTGDAYEITYDNSSGASRGYIGGEYENRYDLAPLKDQRESVASTAPGGDTYDLLNRDASAKDLQPSDGPGEMYDSLETAPWPQQTEDLHAVLSRDAAGPTGPGIAKKEGKKTHSLRTRASAQ
ncbi:uncharacterized protein LOC135831040 isoform X2 [Sycon ciliatum]|uniref:uncharacterized protein LOC135831040 isoform X2 n=1 Tax=Sycon ciliatum TaxID=27933 RepID=UPI0031F68672